MIRTLVSAITVLMLTSVVGVADERGSADPPPEKVPSTQYCELRIYRIYDIEKQRIADAWMQDALIPALNRQKVKSVGAFHNLKDPNDHSLFVLIPWPSLEAMEKSRDRLAADTTYQEAARPFLERDLKSQKGVYDRIESRLTRGFAGMPTISVPDDFREHSDRVFELRLYESHTESYARRKVDMFNQGEIDLMKEVGMAPVFFGETIVGPDMPNLIYMLSAHNEGEHNKHWDAFKASPKWAGMKDLPQYRDTVSKIRNWFLKPAVFSQM